MGNLISSEMASRGLKGWFVSRQKLHLQRIVDDQHRTSLSLSESVETPDPGRAPTRPSDFQIRGRRIVEQNNWKGVVNNVAENYPYLGVLVKKKKKRISKYSPSKVWWTGL